jgi:iron complex transport system permease protein
LTTLLVGVVVMVVSVPVGLRFGAAHITFADIYHAFFHYDGRYTDVVVRQLREPEVFVGIEVGAALAVAGALMQGLTRNPLADSGILGINSGASFFVVLGITLFGVRSPLDFVFFALPGAAFGVALGSVVALAGRGQVTPLKLTLGGVITGLILSAGTQIVSAVNPVLTNQYGYWTAGSIEGAYMGTVNATWPFVVVGLVMTIPLGKALNGLSLGEDMARALGQHVGRTRAGVIAATVLLAGAATAAVGPIAFIGFAVAHMVRGVVGNDYRWLLPLCAVFGADMVVVADIVGRVIIRPSVIPATEVISIVGGLFFLISVCRPKGVTPL